MKTFVKNILAVCAIIFASAVPAYAYDFEVDGMYFNIVSAGDRTCEVTSGDTKYSGSVVIPESVIYKNQEVKIVRIGERAFYNCKLLTSVILSNSISEIGNEAFYNCLDLKSVSIPNSVATIGSWTFYGCGLEYIDIPASVTKIGDYAFSATDLIHITIPESINIGKGLFKNCKNLFSATIDGYIPSETFFGCENIKSVNITGSIGSSAFEKCTGLESVVLSKIGSIGQRAFYGCKGLKSIVIPGSVSNIGVRAFESSGLQNVTFEQSDETLNINSEIVKYGAWGIVETNLFRVAPVVNLSVGRRFKIKDISKGALYDLCLRSFTKLNILDNADVANGFGVFTYADSNPNYPGYTLDYVNLILGSGVVIYPSKISSSLKTITVKDSEPRKCPIFTEKQYMEVILYVPKGSLSAYQNADGWKNFWDIREGDGSEESGIEEVRISSERQEIGRYDIQGRKVSEDYKGFVIIRYSDGSVRKILNK